MLTLFRIVTCRACQFSPGKGASPPVARGLAQPFKNAVRHVGMGLGAASLGQDFGQHFGQHFGKRLSQIVSLGGLRPGSSPPDRDS